MAAPQSVGMNAAKLDQIERLVNQDIAEKKLPGAVVIVGHQRKDRLPEGVREPLAGADGREDDGRYHL